MLDETESKAFGHLVGLIEVRGMSPEEAIDKITEAEPEVDREMYENLVEAHWNDA